MAHRWDARAGSLSGHLRQAQLVSGQRANVPTAGSAAEAASSGTLGSVFAQFAIQ